MVNGPLTTGPESGGLWRHELHGCIAAGRRDIGADETLVAVRSDGCDAEYEVVDRETLQHEFRDVADELCLLPIGCPGLAPVESGTPWLPATAIHRRFAS